MGILENILVNKPKWSGTTDQIKNIIWKKMPVGKRRSLIGKKKRQKFSFEKRRSLGEMKGFTRYPGKPLTRDEQMPRGRSQYEIAVLNYKSGSYGTPDNPHRGSTHRAAFWDAYHNKPTMKHVRGSVAAAHAKAGKDMAKLDKKKAQIKEDLIGKKTASVEDIAKKHGLSVDQIKTQITKGISVEREHTNSDAEAEEIARDHLDEFPDYYDRLDKMETKAKKDMKEDAPAMSVASGAIAGMPTADSPDKTPVRRPMNPLRRKKFAGKTVFVVDPTTYHKAHLGKRKYEHYEKYLEGCDIADYIREYGRKYWAEPIILENEQTGAMIYLKYGSK